MDGEAISPGCRSCFLRICMDVDFNPIGSTVILRSAQVLAYLER